MKFPPGHCKKCGKPLVGVRSHSWGSDIKVPSSKKPPKGKEGLCQECISKK